MRVAALDLSSKTGWAVHDGASDRPFCGTKPLVGWGYDVGQTLEFWRLWLGDFIKLHRPEFVAIEAPFIPEHGDGETIIRQVGLFAFTKWAFKACGVRAVQVYSATWRKHFIGIGSGRPGEELKRRCMARCDQLEWSYPDHNAAEALGILDWAIHAELKLNAPWRDRFLMATAA